jgi:hypothetical protein
MNGDIKVIIGKVEADVPYTDEKNKILIEKIGYELNMEFNRIKSKTKIVNETILLFFLLLKTQSNILQKNAKFNNEDIDEHLTKSLYSISEFIQEDERDAARINKILVAVNIYKKIELSNRGMATETGKSDTELIEDFVSDVEKQIKLMGDKILLL